MQRGFLTIEILLAMMLMTLTFAAVLFASSGTQQFLAGAQSSLQAQDIAQAALAGEQSLSEEDFNLVNTTATSTSGIYKEWVAVSSPENFAKEVTAYVGWSDGRTHVLSLSARITDFADAVGGNTCSSVLVGNWIQPAVATFTMNVLLGDTSTTTYPITDIDAYNGRLYVTVSNTSVNTKTFFIFDISTPMKPRLLGALDNDIADKTGLAAVAVATSSTGNYAYVASASSFAKGQLQIIDVSNPTNPLILKTYKLATSTVPAAGSGNTLFYKDGYVYLGLTKSTGGSEFVIIDVHNPQNPTMVGSYPFGHDVNSILIKNNYAYVLHPTDTTQKQQVTVLDVSNPAQPTLVGSFYTGDTNAHGKSIAVVGNTLYIGMTVSSTTPEFYLLDGSTVQTLSQKAPLVQTEIGSSVVGLLVRDSLAFLLTTKQPTGAGVLQIVSATSAIPVTTMLLPGSGASGVALDCEGNYIYSAANDASNNGSLTIVTGS